MQYLKAKEATSKVPLMVLQVVMHRKGIAEVFRSHKPTSIVQMIFLEIQKQKLSCK